jgi:leucyl-tRNA synthetase
VISPRDYVERYGADTARCYILFIGPPDQGADWSDEGVGGVNRFLARLWRIAAEVADRTDHVGPPTAEPSPLLRKTHWAIDKVTHDVDERFAFNTAISAVMELVNEAYLHKDRLFGGGAEAHAELRFAIATAGSLIFPFAPHLGAEVYELITGGRVWEEPWPVADPELLVGDTVEVVVQVNGKLRARIEAAVDAAPEELVRLARETDAVRRHLDGKEVVKEVVVPGKLVNLVVR